MSSIGKAGTRMTTTLYYLAQLEKAQAIEREGFTDTAFDEPREVGVLLQRDPPEVGGPGVLIEVELDLYVDAYEKQINPEGDVWVGYGWYLIPAAIVNAHTVRRRIVRLPDEADPVNEPAE